MSAEPALAAGGPARFTAAADGSLDGAMCASYARDGFLILEDFVAAADCLALRARADALVQAFDPEVARVAFSTVDQRHAQDRYFLESGDKIRGFFEPEALDAQGHLKHDKALALNKLGHALHDLDPVFDRFSRQPSFAALAAAVGLARPLLLQSMYLFKQPHIGAEVDWHQDASFLVTEPPSVVGFWLAIDDASLANGCLLALPGAHRGPLRQRFARHGMTMTMRRLDATPWPDTAAMPLEVPRGSLVVLHGLLPHGSAANRSSQPRHAYSLHLTDGSAAYADDNWLQRPDLAVRGFA